ncbi:hypothetical protein B0H34DRAFT_657708, partial [Crassisporium funariophilum]
KTQDHALDPDTHCEPGLETASMITITNEEVSELLDNNIQNYYKDVIPVLVFKRLVASQKTIFGESQSHKRSLAPVDAVEKSIETRLAKRHCMTGADIVPRVVGVPSPLIFPIMYDTKDCVLIPLLFFLHKNVRYIIDIAAMLNTVKLNPLDGATKGLQILDISKLSLKLGVELSLTCSQWVEAGWQMYRF